MIRPGEEIHLGAGKRFRVLDVVPFEEEDESPLVAMLKVEAVESPDGLSSDSASGSYATLLPLRGLGHPTETVRLLARLQGPSRNGRAHE